MSIILYPRNPVAFSNWCFMFQYSRFAISSTVSFFIVLLVQPFAFAQSSGAEGADLAAPWTMGNIIVVLFAIGLFALAVRTSNRDLSAIPDEFGKRPNLKDLKKKKKKQKPDFSRGPIKHMDLERATQLTIVAFFIPFILLFSMPVAVRVREEIKGDPRFLGEGTAKTLVILNYVWVGMWVLIFIGTIAGLLIALAAKG
jgi:hypothetical protein